MEMKMERSVKNILCLCESSYELLRVSLLLSYSKNWYDLRMTV